MSENEPPPNELQDLFAAERAAPIVDASTRAALRSRLAAAVGSAPLGHAAAAMAFGGAGKALAVVALTLAAGAGTVMAVRHAARSGPVVQQPVAPPASVAAAKAPNPSPRDEAPAQVPESQPIETAQPHRPQPPVVNTAGRAAVAPSNPSEPQLLKRAWTALSAGEPEQALQLTDQDAELHPDGVLAEEREAARIAALAKLDRMEEARTAAWRFVQEHPSSVHRSLVERAVRSEETP